MFTYTYPIFSNKDDYGACPYGSKTTDVFENSYNVVFESEDSILLDLEGNEVSSGCLSNERMYI